MTSVQRMEQVPAVSHQLQPATIIIAQITQTMSHLTQSNPDPVTIISAAPPTQAEPYLVQPMPHPVSITKATPQTQTVPHIAQSMSECVTIVSDAPQARTAKTMPSQSLTHIPVGIDTHQTLEPAEIFEQQEQQMFYDPLDEGESNGPQWMITDDGQIVLKTALPRQEITIEELLATQKAFANRQQRLENLMEHMSNKLDRIYEFMIHGASATMPKGTTAAQSLPADAENLFAFNLIDTLAEIEKFEEDLKDANYENELVSSI